MKPVSVIIGYLCVILILHSVLAVLSVARHISESWRGRGLNRYHLGVRLMEGQRKRADVYERPTEQDNAAWLKVLTPVWRLQGNLETALTKI